MKKRACLVGVGTITKDYYQGLITTDFLQLVALCDVNPNPPSKCYFPSLPFYTSMQQAIEEQKPDYVIISTPPATHYELIKLALQQGVNVIVEKPALLKIEQFDEINQLANQRNLVFNTSFHWQTGEEAQIFNKLYDSKKIQSIFIHVDDPYSADGVNINPDKIKLEGAFIDSGVNAISLVKTWFPFAHCQVVNGQFIPAQNVNLPIYGKVEFVIDGIPTTIEIDWRNGKNKKITYLTYDDRQVIIDHSQQSIIDGDKIIKCDDMVRLTRHYYNYFTQFSGQSNFDESYKIHELLLKAVGDTNV